MNRKKLFLLCCIGLMLLLALTVGSTITHLWEQGQAGPAKSLQSALKEMNNTHDAEQTVQRAWLLAQQSGKYDFATEIEQTTYQPPALTNVGRAADVQTLYIQGKTDTQSQNFELAIWQGGSVLDQGNALQVRTDGETAYGRTADGEWQPIEDVSASFAPGRDVLAYLHGARNFQEVASPVTGVRQFAFAVDGPLFAEYMRGQLEDELRRAGKLPTGISLDTQRMYRDMVGSGDLWLAANGLPMRLNVSAAFPQSSDGSRVRVVIRTDFRNFGPLDTAGLGAPLAGLIANPSTPPWLANLVAGSMQTDWPHVGAQLAWVLATLLAMVWLLINGRRPLVYAAFTVTILVAMIFSPLLESARVYAFLQEQAAAQKEYDTHQAEDQAQSDLESSLLGSAWDATQDPLAAPASPLTLSSQENSPSLWAPSAPTNAAADTDHDSVPDQNEPPLCVGQTDCDSDTLTDLQEYRLGTTLNQMDSDGDGLRDDMEVKGFGNRTPAGKWYADPLSIDTNGDGLPDSQECWSSNSFPAALPSNLACNRDSDGDGVPDIIEFDNDDDGVDDKMDISPFNTSPTVYDQAIPFLLRVDGLKANEPLFVDLQLVPTSHNQLSYARNVLDWPSGDTTGQIRRTSDTTFASGQSGAVPASESNGDLRLVPMVEVIIPAADAGNLLGNTQTISVPRSLTGYEKVTTGSGETIKTDMVVWLQAQMEFAAQNGNTTMTFSSLTDENGGGLTVDRAKIFNNTACPVASSATPQYQKLNPTTSGGSWPLPNAPLPALLDGKHALVLEKGSGDSLVTACLPLGDVPNGVLPAGWMFDTSRLDAYGANLRDVADANGAVTHLAMYLPASVTTGRTGGEKQAFAVRLPYWPTTNSLGTAQEVRLVWMVQLLNDDGNLQIVHSYNNEGWRLAGLSARQDYAVRSAVLYQNPTDNDNNDPQITAIHSRVWAAAQVMGANFAIDRVGQTRLALNSELISTLENGYLFPQGSLSAVLTTYETQDELALIPKDVTPAILANFLSSGSYRPGYDHALLLFTREEDYTSVVWNGETTLTLPAQSSTLASYNWKPFRYDGGSWKPYPVKEYLDLMRVRIPDTLNAANPLILQNAGAERENVLNGMALAGQSYALSMFYGGNQMVNIAGKAVEREASEEDETVQTIGDDVVKKVLEFVVGEVLEDFIEKFDEVVPVGQTPTSNLAKLGAVLKGKFTEGFDEPGKFSKVKAGAGAGLNGASYALAATSLGLTIAGLAAAESDANVMMAIGKTLDVVANTIQLVEAVQEARKAISAAGTLPKAMQSSANAVSKAAVIAAVVGLVVTSAIAVGIFITQWAMGAFGISDLGFTAALADVMTTIIVGMIMFAIGLIPIVGQIIMAVIALIDAVIAGICAISKAAGYDMEKAGSVEVPRTNVKLSFCAGITGLVTEGVKFTIFSQNVLVDNMTDKDRLKTSNFNLGMMEARLGFQVGNSLRPTLRVDNKIELIPQPVDWKSAIYFWQINWDNLDEATHRYDLTTDKADRNVSTGQMENEWQEWNATTGTLTGSHRSPGIQYDDPLVMVPVTAQLAPGYSVNLDTPGINVSVPLYLREAYANPAQECWWIPPVPPLFIWLPPVCYIRSGDKSTNHIDLQLVYDIFPASLDEFYTPAPKGGGVSLAWGQSGGVTFPAMRDFDGDGLLSSAYGGNDPDDRTWDADADGLSDLFEMEKGSSPSQQDTDADGMNDRQEMIAGSNPRQPDSDGDGLLDGAEIIHEVSGADWAGGWEFVYDIVNGNPQSTWVTSNPKQWNSDGDTLSDSQEQIYGLNPLAISDPTVLKLQSQVREANAPATLLRFEERAGARSFGDSSGAANNATCVGDACPVAGQEGQYTNGLVFDGANDFISTVEAAPLANNSFTVAFWARRDAISTDQAAFSTGQAATNRGLYIGFRSNNVFTCGFYGNDLNTSATYTDNAWHHWACSYNFSTRQRTIYRDGAPVASDSNVSSYQGSGDWLIGEAVLTGWQFNGGLDEVAVIPAALDANQIGLLKDGRYNPGGSQVLAAPGDSLAYQAALENNLLGKNLIGLLSVNLPAGWGNAVDPRTYLLNPTQAQNIQGSLTVGSSAASGAYNLSLTAGAAAISVPQPVPPAPPPPAAFNPFVPPFTDALAAHWSFEYNGNDTSGNARNATLMDKASYTAAFKGQGINLNGSGNYVSVPASVANGTDFTFAAWVYWRGGGNWQRIFDFGQGTAEYLFLTPNNGANLRFVIKPAGGSEQFLDAPSIPAYQWVHVAVTLQGDTGKLYVNGVEQTSGTILANPSQIATGNAWLGKSQNSEDPYFNGMLDEVTVFGRGLTPQEIQDLALAGVTDVVNFDTSDAAVYLPFDKHLLDYNKNTPSGNTVPGGTTASPFQGGVKNNALNLAGENYVRLPKDVANTNDFTFATWVFWRGGGAWQRLFDFGRDQSNYMMLTPKDSVNEMAFVMRVNGNEQKLTTPSQLLENTWVHVAVTLEGDTAKIYLNGQQTAINTAMSHDPNDVFGDSSWLGIGQWWYDDALFNGLLDEVYIFHRALNATQINAMVQAESFDEAIFTFDNPQAPLAYTSNRSATLLGGELAFEQGIGGSQALKLDGKTVLEVNSPSFNMNSTSYSYAVWVKPDPSVGGVQAIFGQPPVAREWQNTNAGLYLWMNKDGQLQFGWGGSGSTPWNTGWVRSALTPGIWNHVAVTFDGAEVRLYTNGNEVFRKSPASRPMALYTFAVGDNNYCAEFELKNVFTVEEGDPLDWDAEYEYRFQLKDTYWWTEMLYDGNADSREWEPGDGPGAGDIFTDKKYTYCGSGARVHVVEVDSLSSNDNMSPDKWFDLGTPNKVGYNSSNYSSYSSGDLSGDGTVRYYYEIHNPALSFKGSLDELRIYRRGLSEEEVQRLYAAGAVPYHYTLDDPPGAGLNTNLFNFKNEGSIANPKVSGFCDPGHCPTSGLPGRSGQAALFTSGQSIKIDNLMLPATAPGFSIWVNPNADGQVFNIIKGTSIISTVTRNGEAFCLDGKCSSTNYAPGQWVHLMVNFDQTGSHLYINGFKQADSLSQWGNSGLYQVILGGGFSGLLDDFRIPYNGGDVKAMYSAVPGVLLHLEENANATSFVNVGGASAACSGNTCPGAGRKGKVGQAAVFDGINDQVNAGQAINLISSFTVAFWARRDSVNASNIAFSIGNATTNILNIGFRSNNLFTCSLSDNGLNTPAAYTDNAWNHWACTYNAVTGQRTIYRNGVQVAQDKLQANYQVNGNWAIGNASIGGSPFNGGLDEIVVYGQALRTYEIQSIYTTQANWTEEKNTYDILVDADLPTSSLEDTLPLPINYYPNADKQLGVKAIDATSAVAFLELGVSRDGGATTWIAAEPCQDAASGDATSPAWCPWFKPTSLGGEGRYVVQTRATDSVGNRETPAPGRMILVDVTGPTITVNQADGSLQNLLVYPGEENAQALLLDGTVSDPNIGSSTGSGVSQVWVILRNADGEIVGDAPYPAVINGDNWSLQYPFLQAQVGGSYILEISASDQAGNQGTLPNRRLALDGAAPGMTLGEAASGLPQNGSSTFVTQTVMLSGWVSERAFPSGVRYAYPFEENTGAVSFANVVASSSWSNASAATCGGATCPTAGGAGYDGRGINFDGSNDYLSLPASVAQAEDFTFAAWVYWGGGANGQHIFDFGTGTAQYLFLTPNSGANTLRFAIQPAGSSEEILNAPSIPANQWVHVAVTLQGDTGKLYVNGVEQTNGTILANPSDIKTDFSWLGKSQNLLDPNFNGQMDQVAVYHRALTGDEIRVLAATQVAGTQSPWLSFTSLWADENGAAISPYVSTYIPNQTLYLPLDETRDQIQNTTYRNLAQASAPASCSSVDCPESGGESPAGGAASFDGRNDYLSLPASVVAQAEDFTFAAWVYWRGGANGQRIFNFGQEVDRYLALTPNSSANTLRFAIKPAGGSEQILDAASITANQWVHVAVTLQGNTGRMYVNGLEQASNPNMTINPAQVAGNNNWLGRSSSGSDPYFNGMMNNVRIFNRALSGAEIQSLWYGPRAVLSLLLDERFAVNGAALPDAGGWDQTATLRSGAADTANKSVAGNSGPYALSFDGVDDQVIIPHTPSLSLDRFTIGLWVKPGAQKPDWQPLLAKAADNSAESNYGLFIAPDSTQVRAYVDKAGCASNVMFDSNTALPLNAWSHVALTYDGAFLRLYINGALDQSVASTGGLCQTSNNIWIGRFDNAKTAFNGALDDVRIYPRPLNQAEITDLNNARWRQANVDGSQWMLGVPAGLEGMYRLDLSAVDNAGHTSFNDQVASINQTIDSQIPRVTFTHQTGGAWGNQSIYTFTAEDLFLTETGLATPCGANGTTQRTYRQDAASGVLTLTKIQITCKLPQRAASETASARDGAGNVASCSAPGTCTQPLVAGPEAKPGDTEPSTVGEIPADGSEVAGVSPLVAETSVIASSTTATTGSTTLIHFNMPAPAAPIVVSNAEMNRAVQYPAPSFWAQLTSWVSSITQGSIVAAPEATLTVSTASVSANLTANAFTPTGYAFAGWNPAGAAGLTLAPAAASDDFVITIKTDNPGTSSSTQFTIPTYPGETYDYNVDCDNDGTNEATAQTGDYTCNYGVAGTYTIRIKDNTGVQTGFPRIYFQYGGGEQKLLTIAQWGTGKWTSMSGAFYYCANVTMTATDMPDLSGVTDMSNMFRQARAFNGDIGGWDTSKVTNMSGIFQDANAFNQPILSGIGMTNSHGWIITDEGTALLLTPRDDTFWNTYDQGFDTVVDLQPRQSVHRYLEYRQR